MRIKRTMAIGTFTYVLGLLLSPNCAMAMQCIWSPENPECQYVAVEIVRCKRYESVSDLVRSEKYRIVAKDSFPSELDEPNKFPNRLEVYVKIIAARAANCENKAIDIDPNKPEIGIPTKEVLLSLDDKSVTSCDDLRNNEELFIERNCCDGCTYWASAEMSK